MDKGMNNFKHDFLKICEYHITETEYFHNCMLLLFNQQLNHKQAWRDILIFPQRGDMSKTNYGMNDFEDNYIHRHEKRTRRTDFPRRLVEMALG